MINARRIMTIPTLMKGIDLFLFVNTRMSHMTVVQYTRE